MIIPLGVMYILANITFQMAVKNSRPDGLIDCTECWNYTHHFSDHVKYFNAFKLINWYYNPLLWVVVLCFGQAISHIFERKWIDFNYEKLEESGVVAWYQSAEYGKCMHKPFF